MNKIRGPVSTLLRTINNGTPITAYTCFYNRPRTFKNYKVFYGVFDLIAVENKFKQ